MQDAEKEMDETDDARNATMEHRKIKGKEEISKKTTSKKGSLRKELKDRVTRNLSRTKKSGGE